MRFLPSKTTIALVLAGLPIAVGAISYAGRKMIQASVIYPMALEKIHSEFGVVPGELELRLFSPFEFFETNIRGSTAFVLCQGIKCYQVAGEKRMGDWSVKAWEK